MIMGNDCGPRAVAEYERQCCYDFIFAQPIDVRAITTAIYRHISGIDRMGSRHQPLGITLLRHSQQLFAIDALTGSRWRRECPPIRRDGRCEFQKAHRLAWEALVGPIPAGMVLDHVHARGCRHKHCINPAHLEPVTRAENTRRALRNKLNAGTAAEVRELHGSGRSAASIGREYGISDSAVLLIWKGELWAA